MRTELNRFARAVVQAVVFLIVLGSCTYRPDDGKPSISPGPSQNAPKRGGVLTIAVADDAAILDPQLSSEPSGFALVRATQRGLMAFPAAEPASAGGAAALDPTIPVPDLAESIPDVSADGTLYTFRLRAGAAFGPPAARPVRSTDVKAGIERLFRVGSPLRVWLHVIAGAAELDAGRAKEISGIETPDAATVRIRLLRPDNDLLWMLAHTAASAVPAGTPAAVAPGGESSSGPYRVASAEPGRSIRLVRNPAWKAESDPVRRAWVDEIRVVVGATDDADVAGEEVAAPPFATIEHVDAGCLLSLFLSPLDKRLASRDVRAGIALAIARKAVLDAAVAADPELSGTAAAALLPPGSAGAVTRGVSSPDLARARTMIGSGFSIVLGRETTGPDATADSAAASAVQRMLAAVGVKAGVLGATDPASIYDRYASGDAPMGLARWCPDWPGRAGRPIVGGLLGTGGPANYGRFSDSVLDRMIASATAERDPAKIAPAWASVEARALAAAAVVPLAFLTEAVPISRRVAGFHPHPFFVRGDPTSLWLRADVPPVPRIH